MTQRMVDLQGNTWEPEDPDQENPREEEYIALAGEAFADIIFALCDYLYYVERSGYRVPGLTRYALQQAMTGLVPKGMKPQLRANILENIRKACHG